MGQSEVAESGMGLKSHDPLVKEAHLMAHDYLEYVTTGGAEGIMGNAPSVCTAALRHAGDELLTRFPIFFKRWPRVFQDVTATTACPMLVTILDDHFFPVASRGRRRDLAWSAVLSVYVLAGQMALHCQEKGMEEVLPELKACVGEYVERVVCPEIRDKGGWSGFVSRFGAKLDWEVLVKKVCSWTLVASTVCILTYFIWRRTNTTPCC